MPHLFRLARYRLLCALCALLFAVVSAAEPLAAQSTGPSTLVGQPLGIDAAEDHPRHCIDPLKAAHIAATLISFLPIPGWSNAADAAAYAANIGLKFCPPELIPPPDIIIEQPNQGCSQIISLPIPRHFADLVELDRVVIEELLNDPAALLSVAQRAELQAELAVDFGRFQNSVYSTYMNVYGIVLPGSLSEYVVPNWGGVGAPRIYHYNSDVFIELSHPGQRISPYAIEVPVGSHTLFWQADTLISNWDYFPTFLITGAYGAYKAAQAKAAKRTAIRASNTAFQQQLQQVLREGNRFFAREFAREVAINAAKTAAISGANLVYKASPLYSLANYSGAQSTATQRLVILDTNPPVISGVESIITLEATDPGGMASGRMMGDLKAAITVIDDCDPEPTLEAITPRFWPLLLDDDLNPLPSGKIIWRASDKGAATPEGGVNTTEVVQTVLVVDTEPPIVLPPPPVMMYAEPGGVEVPLGLPQVFDVVDLRPTIRYEAPSAMGDGERWPIFDLGIHYVDWTATDQSQNTSEPEQQLVNIKAPGTNNVPTAFDQVGGNAIAAVADETVRITIRGEDPDVDPVSGMRDPIWFTIDQQPPNGFFIAPLYPYFVDDYRITSRYSPQIAEWEGEEFAWSLAQNPDAMRQYIFRLCDPLQGGDIHRTDLPKDFVNGVGHIAVDDDGYTFIYDTAYRRCTPGGSTVSPTTSPRISVWGPDGLYVGEQGRGSDGRPLHSVKFDARGYILATSSDSSSTGDSLINIYRTQTDNPEEPIVEVQTYTLWNRVNSVVVNDEGDTRTPRFINATVSAWDNDASVLYVIGRQNLRGMAAFTPAQCSVGDSDPERCLDFVDVQIYSLPIEQSTRLGDFPGFGADAMRLTQLGDLAVDSRGYVYVTAAESNNRFDRIYRFEPAVVNEDGSFTLGELEGWMGRCDEGPNCNFVDGRSIGFACTDETCFLNEGTPRTGDRPGQFDSIAALAIDPNDVLYVADAGNERVQRFSPDGLFAGEAQSQAACENCSGFVLGDFGRPNNITVNSSQFYVLDQQEGLVHIFEASVVNQIDDASAWVEYQSKSNYVGADFFAFRATDGFRTAEGELVESAPAQVDIDVARNFRAPIARSGLRFVTPEDTPVEIMLEGDDLDGDPLTYAVVAPPQHGTLSGNPPNLTYTPVENFFGEDTFTFNVSKMDFTSDPEIVRIQVDWVNDPPELTPKEDPIRSGLGHATALSVHIFDPDPDEELRATVDWGDGTVESDGEIHPDGSIAGPVVTPLLNSEAEVVAYHTYASAGTYPVAVKVTDAHGGESTANIQVIVEPMADLQLEHTGSSVIPSDQNLYSYELIVRNPSANGTGIRAENVQVSEILTGSASYTAAIPQTGECQVEQKQLSCALGSLNPDQEISIIIQIGLSGAGSGSILTFTGEATSSTPDPLPENSGYEREVAVVPVGDFYVNSVRDGVAANPGDGVCATVDGACTLRAAIMEANSLSGSQTIVLGYGVFVLEEDVGTATGETIDAAAGDLDITGDMVILGIGAEKSTIHGNGIDRVLEIHSGEVRIERLSLSGGDAGQQEGGGLLVNGGDVTLRQVAISGNRGVNGGGIMHKNGALHIEQSSITDNTATSSGGGIMNQADLTLANVTLARNRADGGGGLLAVGGNAELTHVTIVGNSADNAGGGINATGTSVRLVNSILAGNDAPIGPNCAPELVSGGYNLFGSQAMCNVSGDTGGNLTEENTGLDPLTENELETYSYPLNPDSPAIGRVAPSRCAEADQRGALRNRNGGCDMGAFEQGIMGDDLYLPAISR